MLESWDITVTRDLALSLATNNEESQTKKNDCFTVSNTPLQLKRQARRLKRSSPSIVLGGIKRPARNEGNFATLTQNYAHDSTAGKKTAEVKKCKFLKKKIFHESILKKKTFCLVMTSPSKPVFFLPRRTRYLCLGFTS